MPTHPLPSILAILLTFLLLAACGGEGGAPATNSPPSKGPRFTYMVNLSAGTVSIYTVDATDGHLRHSGYALKGGRPISIAVDPSGRFAYVVNFDSSNVSAYTINPSTGALTSVGEAVPGGTFPFSITVAPSGRFAYVAMGGNNDVWAYTINASTGALTSVGAPVGVGSPLRTTTTTGSSQ